VNATSSEHVDIFVDIRGARGHILNDSPWMCFCDHVELIVDDEDVWDVDEPFQPTSP
jgi:hypothetical protein